MESDKSRKSKKTKKADNSKKVKVGSTLPKNPRVKRIYDFTPGDIRQLGLLDKVKGNQITGYTVASTDKMHPYDPKIPLDRSIKVECKMSNTGNAIVQNKIVLADYYELHNNELNISYEFPEKLPYLSFQLLSATFDTEIGRIYIDTDGMYHVHVASNNSGFLFTDGKIIYYLHPRVMLKDTNSLAEFQKEFENLVNELFYEGDIDDLQEIQRSDKSSGLVRKGILTAEIETFIKNSIE